MASLAMDKENIGPGLGNCMVFSPPAKAEKPAKKAGALGEVLPMLLTARFQKTLSIEFGNVSVNAMSSQRFRLTNPNDAKSVTVTLDRIPAADKGFSIVLGDGDTVVIPGGGSVIGHVHWKPTHDMSVASSVTLKLNDNSPLQMMLRGIAGSGQAPAAPTEKVDFATKRKALAAIADNNNIRDSELTQRHTFKPIAPASSAAKQENSNGQIKRMYDDKWADKQIESFTEWINFTLSQSSSSTDDDETSNTGGATLRLLMQRRMEAQIRQRAMLIFHSSQVAVPLFALGEDISDEKLVIRSDRNVHADLGLQETMFGLLFSYELPWLRLGLEVVFGQIISCKSASGDVPCKPGDVRWKKVLKTFIFDHLFADADIQAKPQYSQQKLLAVKNQEALKKELRAHLVKKFLALVLVMNMAREQRLLSLPTLFVSTATPGMANEQVKSSKEVLLLFCKEFLRGEGDFVRHLGLMGYNVSFTQCYTDEFNYAVTNLAVDLRDGVRLTRLVEVLTKTNDLSRLLRVPAVSLMQKIHNVKLATDRIYSDKCDVEPKAIVEGNRDMTLLLLWKLMFNFELKMLIDPARVRKEAAAIRQNQAWRRSVYDAAEAGSFAVTVPVVDVNGSVNYPTPLPPSAQDATQANSYGIKGMDDSALACALLEWCDAVAGQYGVPVYNLSSCLADGRALCLLVHYYHPSILPTKVIKKTTQNIAAAFSSNTCIDAFTEPMIEVPKQEVRRALDGERKNFSTLKKACSDIGGIPAMLSLYDSNNVPEAKTMTIFLGYLFARLIESSEQVRAAIRIQRTFRRAAPKLRRSLCAKPSAVGKAKMAPLLRTVSSKAREVDNVVTDVQVTVVMSSHRAASLIQRLARTFVTRKAFLRFVEQRADAERVRALEMAQLEQLELEKYEAARRAEETAAAQAAAMIEEEAARKAEEEESHRRVTEIERLQKEAAIQEQVRLLEMHEETALRALEEAETARLEKEAADEAREEALREAEEMRAEAGAEAERVAELEEKVFQYEEAQYRVEEEARALEEMRIQLEAQVEAGQMTQAALLEQLEVEKSAKHSAEALLHAKFEELAALDAKIAEEKLLAMQQSAMEREAEVVRVAQEKMELAVRAEKDAREAAEAHARIESEQRQILEARIRELEASRATEMAAAQEAERARSELEAKLADELAVKVEQARIAAEKEARRKLDEEAASSAAAVQAERQARAVLEEQMRAEAAARQAVEAQLLAMEEARLRQEQETQRLAEEARLASLMRNAACQLIQTAWRQFHELRKYRLMQTAVVRLQATARGFAVRRQIAKLRLCSSIVQGIWRERRMQRQLSSYNSAAIKIQCNWRAHYQQQQYMAYTLNLSQEMAASTMQAESARLHREALENQAVTTLRKWFHSRLMVLKVHRLVGGFRRLQACFRSRSVRRTCSSEVKAMLQRIKLAEQRAAAQPALCLGQQTKASLEVLQGSKSISALLRACETLELSTQLSVRCCEAFANAQASSVLFGLIRSCNRSTPHQEVLRHALVVLLNVARHPSLAGAVAQCSDSTDVLVDLMQMFRDKKPIFCLSCELLGRLAAVSEVIKNLCNSAEYRKRLDGILSIIERKHRLDARVKNIGTKTAVEFVGSPKGRGRFLSEMEPIHGIQHLFFVLTR